MYAYIRGKNAAHRGRPGTRRSHERAGLFACSLSDGYSGGFSVQEPRDHREKEKSKKVLLYPRAPLKIKCFCNEFDLTIVESNQGRDAVQSPGEGVVGVFPIDSHGNSRGRHKQAQTRFLVRCSAGLKLY